MGGFRSIWERRLGKTESPIEALLLEALCACAIHNGYEVARQSKAEHSVIHIQSQRWIDRVRVDFLIRYPFHGKTFEAVVECDGHAFHERTKEQAKRDRQRDRNLQRAGYHVFRFTGSEINGAPRLCASEILDAIMEFQTQAFVSALDEAGRQAREVA